MAKRKASTNLNRDRSPPNREHKWRFIKCGRYCRTTTRVLIMSFAVDVGMKLFLERRWLNVDRYIFSRNWHNTCRSSVPSSETWPSLCTRRKVDCWSSWLLQKVWNNVLESVDSSWFLKSSRNSKRRRKLSRSGIGLGLRLWWRLILALQPLVS